MTIIIGGYMDNSLNESKKILWSDDFLTGVESVDLQHKYFLNLINKIFDYAHNGCRNLKPYDIFQEIQYYAQFHFTSEENLMIEWEYPGLDIQKKEHRILVEHFLVKINNFSNESNDMLYIYDYLINWFCNHTLIDDKEMGKYLKKFI